MIAERNPHAAGVAWLYECTVGQKVPIHGYRDRQAERIEELRRTIHSIIPAELPADENGMIRFEEFPSIPVSAYGLRGIKQILSEKAGFTINGLTQTGDRKRWYRRGTVGRDRPAGIGIYNRDWPLNKIIPIWTCAGKLNDKKHHDDLAWCLDQLELQYHVGTIARIEGPILATGVAEEVLRRWGRGANAARLLLEPSMGNGSKKTITTRIGEWPNNCDVELTISKNLIDAHLKNETFDLNYSFEGTTLKLYKKYASMIPESMLPSFKGRRVYEVFENPLFENDERQITSARRSSDNHGNHLVLGISRPREARIIDTGIRSQDRETA